MNFEEALQSMLHGEKIRRIIWDHRKTIQWMESDGTRVKLKLHNGESVFVIRDWSPNETIFSLNDVIADDWEIYDEQEN